MTQHPATPVLDFGAAALVVSSIAGWLPPIAAGLGIIWYCVLLYDRFTRK